MRRALVALLLVALPRLTAAPAPSQSLPATQSGLPTTRPPASRTPDVIWVPTLDAVVAGMLDLAKVTKDDVVYDLGCGDGKIVIAAAKQFGARGVGVDIDPQRIADANLNARAAGVTDRVTFVLGDIFDPAIPIRDATVVMLYLLPDLNVKLRPRLWRELKPGTRVVSNSFPMGDWAPDKTTQIENFTIYFWTIKAGMK